MPDYPRFPEALAEADGQPKLVFDALCNLTRSLVGAKLFTIMTFDSLTNVAQRVYSNMPEAYPVSGTKPANPTDWSRHVIEQRRTFVANDIDGIRAVFDDHALIRSLGCESVINVPIVAGGDLLGTLNCLHEAGFYTEERVRASEALKLPGIASLLLNERLALRRAA